MNRRVALTAMIGFLMYWGGARLTAQTTQPASAWSTTVMALANALVDQTDDSTLCSLVSEDTLIRQFNRTVRETPMSLHQQFAGMSVLAARGYPGVPEELASDLAADFKGAELPETIKRKLIAADDADTRRANTTAAKWITMTLEPSEGEPVGVIVLWQPEQRDSSTDENAPPAALPMFVLVRGERTGRDSFRIRQIHYGDPLPLGGG
jgi:hypothetical protein